MKKKVKKASAKGKAKTKKGLKYTCDACGMVVTVDKECCCDPCGIACCGQDMRPMAVC